MKISNSKKQLAKIIHENGGWFDGAEWASQDKIGVEAVADEIAFYEERPSYTSGADMWNANRPSSTVMHSFPSGGLLKNWHQTILSREEYFHLYPAPDHSAERKAEIRWVRGKDIYATPTAHDCMEMLKEKWGSTECGCDECSAFYSKPAAHAESTIEQLATDYRNRKDYADRKQQEADAAKADAEAKLAELVAAGKAHGLVLSVADTRLEPEPELEPGITDWRDLLVGDEVECVRTPYGASCTPGMFGVVTEVTAGGVRARFDASLSGRADGSWFSTQGGGFRFIRRPAKGAANA